jgi:WD40 repeat protein
MVADDLAERVLLFDMREYDIFLSFAAADLEAARELKSRLSPPLRVFLANDCGPDGVDLGEDWDLRIPEAQQKSSITVVLVSSQTTSAFYQRDEVRAAISQARKAPALHRVIPVFLDARRSASDRLVPAGLLLKQGIEAMQVGGLQGVAKALLEATGRFGLISAGFNTNAQNTRTTSSLIDFSMERVQHSDLLGREEVTSTIDRVLAGKKSRGWILVTGSPGRGKSAILSHYLNSQDISQKYIREIPHHLLRRGVANWARPEVVVRSLLAQLEKIYPGHVDVCSENNIHEALHRISENILVPQKKRILIVVDGLDEVELRSEDSAIQNPFPQFLPNILAQGVFVLCASRPIYPGLAWLKAQGDFLFHLDLDDKSWSSSNEKACRIFWEIHARRHNLPKTFIDEAVSKAEGNLLHAKKLKDWLDDQVTNQCGKLRVSSRTRDQTIGSIRKHRKARSMLSRRAATLSTARRGNVTVSWLEALRIPQGLDGILEKMWESIKALPENTSRLAKEGLAILCAARKALPLSTLKTIAGWSGTWDTEKFLQATRSFLLEERLGEQIEYRPYHGSFREFMIGKFNRDCSVEDGHKKISKTLAAWPPVETAWRTYGLQYAVVHRLEARNFREVHKICLDLEFLEAKCREFGVSALEFDLRSAFEKIPFETEKLEVFSVYESIRIDSHWLQEEPGALPSLLYNRLMSVGWDRVAIEETFFRNRARPLFRLRFPVDLGNREVRTLVGHRDTVSACALTPDEQHAVSSSLDATLRMWELQTGQSTVLRGHSAAVRWVTITPDGKSAISASDDTTLKVWDIKTGQLKFTLYGHTDAVRWVSVTPDNKYVVSASKDTTLKVWQLETGYLLLTLQGHSASVRGVVITPDSTRAISVSDDATLRIWELQTEQSIVLRGHSAAVRWVTITPDGKSAISASDDTTLKVWDIKTGQLKFTLYGHTDVVWNVTSSLDGKFAVSASGDAKLKVWNLDTGQAISTLQGHSAAVLGVEITPNNKYIVSSSVDKKLNVWDLNGGQLLSTLRGHSDAAWRVTITSDSKYAISTSKDKTLKIWEIESPRKSFKAQEDYGAIQEIRIAPKGDKAVVVSWNNTLKVYDLRSGSSLFKIQDGQGFAWWAAVTSDGTYAVSASLDKTLKVWNLLTGRIVYMFKASQSNTVRKVIVTPDGRRMISLSGDVNLKVWGFEEKQVISTLQGNHASVRAVAPFPDNKRVLTVSEDGVLRVWDIESGSIISMFSVHTNIVANAVVTHDGGSVILTSLDKTVKLWDIATGKIVSVFHEQPKLIRRVIVKPDRKLVICCLNDSTIKVWNLEVSRWVAVFQGHTDLISDVVMDRHNSLVVSVSKDRTAKFWDIASGCCVGTIFGVSPFLAVSFLDEIACLGDSTGNFWIIECALS